MSLGTFSAFILFLPILMRAIGNGATYVQEQDRHDQLLARGGLYRKLWQMQAGVVVSGDGQHAEVSAERLRAIPLFRDVNLDALSTLAGRFVSRLYQPGQDIYAQGDAGDWFYLVVRGTVSISTLDAGKQASRLVDPQRVEGRQVHRHHHVQHPRHLGLQAPDHSVVASAQ